MAKGRRTCPCGHVPALCKKVCEQPFTEGCHEEALKDSIEALAETGQLDYPIETPTMRECVLDGAKELVASTRNEQYGEPIDNFGRWAGMLQSLGYRGPGGRDLLPHDISVLMTCGKLSRAVQTPDNPEHWTDGCGYLANGYECVTLEGS